MGSRLIRIDFSYGSLAILIKRNKTEPVLDMILSKWFYDIFTGAATEAARCGFSIGEEFGLLVASYG
jgi:hypothetical protein